jgi:hypothetical protein
LYSHAQGEKSRAAFIHNIDASEPVNGGKGINEGGVSRSGGKYDIAYSLFDEYRRQILRAFFVDIMLIILDDG